MGERTSYPPGTPCWVDVGVPDVGAAAEFYGTLLGWEFEDLGPDAGGYGQFTLKGKYVAGIGPQQMPDVPPFWTVYVSVADADAAAAKVVEHGGTVVAPAMDVFDAGRMAVFQDPQGTFISVWQPKDHIGAELVNEWGTWGWNELASTDIAASNAFYEKVFGWTSGEFPGVYYLDGRMICGGHEAGEGEFPAWSVWFSVEDCDDATLRVTDLGGSVVVPPSDMSFGRGSVVAAPDGAVFGLAGVDADKIDP